jgi:hypothetical protein
MANVKLCGGPSGIESSVEIDGEDWSRHVSGLSIDVRPDKINAAQVDVIVEDAQVTVDGDVIVDGHYLSEEMARAFYDDLRRRFDADTEDR